MVTPGSQMGYAVEPTDLWELESDVFYFSILSLWLTLQILTSISLLASDFFLESSKLTLTITLVNIKPLGSTHFYSYEQLQPHGVVLAKNHYNQEQEKEVFFQAPTTLSPIYWWYQCYWEIYLLKTLMESWFPGMEAFHYTTLPRQEDLNSIPEHSRVWKDFTFSNPKDFAKQITQTHKISAFLQCSGI